MTDLSLVRRLRTSAFLKDTATLTAGTVLAQGINVLAMPVLSRLYAPAEFGELAVFTAVFMISATLVTLRYEPAVMLPCEEEKADGLARLSIGLAFAIGLPLILISSTLSAEVRGALGVASIGKWLPLALLAGVASAVIATATVWLNRHRRYSLMAGQRIAQVLIASGVGIGCGLAGQADGLLLAQLIALVSLAALCLWQIRPAFRSAGWHMLLKVGLEQRASPAWLLPTALLDVVSLQLPALLVAAWFSGADAGQFSMSWRILSLPVSLVGIAVGQVFYQRFSRRREDPEGARQLLLNTWKMLLLIGALPAVIVMLFGEALFGFVLGQEWEEAGRIGGIIAPMLLAMLVVSPTSSAVIALGLQKWGLWFGIVTFCYRPLCLWIGYRLGDLHTGLLLFTTMEVIAIGCYQKLLLAKLGRNIRGSAKSEREAADGPVADGWSNLQ